MLKTFRSYYDRHAKWMPLAFFVLGFLFDAFMLRRIDDLFAMLQQAAYLAITGTLINYELLEHCGKLQPGTGIFSKAWKYREALTHFMLGTLLNAYTIFYFKSASVVTSFVFVGFLVVILTINEFVKFGGSQTAVHMALWSLCLISYSVYIVPILAGFIGVIPFIGAMVASATLSAFVYFRLRKTASEHGPLVNKRVLLPFAVMHLLFVGLYFTQSIPPVPLSVSFIGIYHDVKKEDGKYVLSYNDTSWSLLHHGDQAFAARPDDKVYCFARIFSPARFRDEVMVRWLQRNDKGRWIAQDAIPLKITGGREEGFRGYTVKTNYSPGEWRCQIETSDNREIGRITFQVAADDSTDERPSLTDVQ